MEDNINKGPGAPYGNQNALKWDYEASVKLFDDMLEESYTGVDFLGTLQRKFKITRNVITLILDRYPDLKETWDLVKESVESNCYENAKKAKGQAIYIINLKSNHKWTDRIQTDTDITFKPTDINDIFGFDEE